jgi:Family of unknown function (DUF6188)
MTSLTETAERWEVDLRGRTVEMLTIDHRLTFHLHDDASYEGSIILASPFRISVAGRDAIALDPEEKTTLTPALECFGKAVAAVSVSRQDGALTLAFMDGTVIGCPSDPQYEAWEVNAPGVKIVATPGGGEPALLA